MIFIVLIFFVILLFVALIVSKNNVFSPSVVTTTIWIFCLLLFLLLQHTLPPYTSQFLSAVSLWVFLYVLSSMLMQSAKFSVDVLNYEPSKFLLDIYFWFSICTFPLLLMFASKAIVLGPTGHWATDLRLAAMGQTEHFKVMYGGFYFLIWNAAYLVELSIFSKKNRHRVFILGFFMLCYALVTMSKYSFLNFFLQTICLLYFTQKVKLKHLLIGLGCLFFLFIVLQSARHATDMSSASAKEDFLVLYLLSSMSAFDTLLPASAEHFGENTFRFFYAIFYDLGLSNVKPVDIILPWIEKPIETNTYTGMYPFFKDFGYWGVGVFAAFFGFLFGWMFKKAQKGNTFFIVMYSFFICMLVAQYVGDIFFAGVSGHVKFIIVLLLPFLATKYKWFYSKVI